MIAGMVAALGFFGGCAETAGGGGGGFAKWQLTAAREANGGLLREAAAGNGNAVHDIFQMALDPTIEDVEHQTYNATLYCLYTDLGPLKFMEYLDKENAETRKAVAGACGFASPGVKAQMRGPELQRSSSPVTTGLEPQ